MQALLAIKLHRPDSPIKHIERPQLIQRLNLGLECGHQIFLVSAPAGFGKTTCITEWVNSLPQWPVTWLSLDTSDDDPGRFFSYLLSALQKVDEHIGEELEGVLRAGEISPVEAISTVLINDMLKIDSSFLLVLDDFHVIQEQLILEFFEKLLIHVPQPLHLVFITREDPPLPLAQIRANNQLTEIRANDLRFASNDMGRFLSEVIGISLSPADIQVLENKTEGWIVGLQLAGLSIREQENPSSFIRLLSGSHRHILGYLTEQVVDRQPEEIQCFLLRTSILDKLNGDLCNAVADRKDSHALLERLYKANLFLVPLDDDGHWYRYHHLFADLLRTLQKSRQQDKTAELHQRASRWYAEVGMLSDAIQHTLVAEDYSLAVNLLESHALGMIMQGYARTVNGWLQLLPEDWRRQSPRTNLAFAWTHLLRGAYSQALPYLEQLEEFFSGSQENEEVRRALKAEWLVMQSLLLTMKGKTTESLAIAQESLTIVPEDDQRVRGLAYFSLASTYQAMEKEELAIGAYRTAGQYARESKNAIVEMLSTSGLTTMAFEHGQLHLAHEIASPVSARMERSDFLPPISTVVFGILGEVYYQWGKTDEARRYMLRALQLSILGGLNSGMINCRVLLSRLSLLEGDLEAAIREIQEAIELLQVDTPDYVQKEALAQQVRVHLALAQPAAAERVLQGEGFSFENEFSHPDVPPRLRISHSAGLLYNSALRVLLYRVRVRGDMAVLRSGIQLANRLIHGALDSQTILVALETLLLRAQIHARLRDHPASQADYVRALELAEPEDIISIFVEQGAPVAADIKDLIRTNSPATVHADYFRRLLDAFSGLHPPREQQTAPALSQAAGATPLIGPLTDREIDVLRLMADGLKYKEIATALFVSQNTVRYHVKSIYGKLNVNNRTQAIRRARQLRIF